MMKKGKELGEYLKGKRVLIMAGQLCGEVEFNGKKLLDYVVEISNKLNAPIAATGNTSISLREKGAKKMRKMWAMELVNYIRLPWEKEKEHPPIMDEKPEVLLLIGYSALVAQNLASAVREEGGKTMVLGSTYVEGATYSFPDFSSLKQWQENLEEFIESLG